jgi:hypothetical protein
MRTSILLLAVLLGLTAIVGVVGQNIPCSSCPCNCSVGGGSLMCHDCCDGCTPDKAVTSTFKAKITTPKPKLMAPKKDTPCEEACYTAAAQCDAECGEPCRPGDISCSECVSDCSSSQQDCLNACTKKSTKQINEQEYQSIFSAFVKKYNKKSVRTGGRQTSYARLCPPWPPHSMSHDPTGHDHHH